MKISRFFGANSRDVMRQVRQVLGPDALIVSNRSVDGGIEVLATVEGAFDDAQQHAQEPAPRGYADGYARAAGTPAPQVPPAPAAPRLQPPPAMPASYGLGAHAAMAPPPHNASIAPPAAPQPGYAVPSRSIAAYQSAYATPGVPEQEVLQEPVARQAPPAAVPPAAQVVAAPAPAGPVRMEMPALPPARPAPPAAPAPMERPAPSVGPSPMARMPDAPLRNGPAMPPAALPNDAAAGLQDAISALRGALESRMDGLLWGGRQGPGREPAGAALFRSLLDAGFSTKLVRTLVERMPAGATPEAALAWARNELVTHLPVLGSEDEFLGGGVYALVGPTGVGKTTTLAKLAARCVAREGREQVAMLTTDNFRIGALEQLQIYGRLMGVPAHSVRDAGELRRILGELGNRKIVLIDTTGISQRDRQVAEQASMLCNAGKPVRRLLVLNAASQGDTLDEVAHAYRNGVGEDVAGCIITKLDEASRLGAALDTAIRHRLPIHYSSIGQKVPEHLELARADALIDRAFAMVERARALYAPSEADMASLWSTPRETEAVDPARRRQLLASAILRPQAGAGSIEAAQNLDDTLGWLDSDPACVQARASWREYVSDGAGSSLAALGETPLAMARREFPTACGRHLLAMHGKTSMKGEGLPGGTLLSTMLMSDRGAALAAPAQQLVLPHGMLSSFAPAAAAQPDTALALEARVRWLGEQLARLPLVHMLEAGTSALWQSLSGQGASWVARSPGGMRVIQDECPTNLNAVGKSVGYLPVGQPGDMPGLRAVPGTRPAPLALWASGTEIGLPGRGEETRLRLVCARLIDTASGEVAGQLFGLTNLAASQADAATVARWLVLQEEARAGFRYMANAWQALPAVDGAHTLARQSLMAGQLGAACWQLAHAPTADGVRATLSGVVSPERKLTGRLLPVALLKMFAMLEMAGGV
ncbi:flagellar biosynthesis protein FlhF [Achromobacter xylosoxidans]|uniref:flagellar biosynthesis protein FlhF n=6 Tax=Alcaligenes xylosoxydans xylosoxydans TaxID=85698 RepID=UPI0012325F16|nr:flagellar biosynthesis protein FlhF [Achromobacter xylosoxidans]KAA5924658.1 flagellar biosynthesis protein FlhF [Achromobacter xylosoxidans]MBK1979606.1 flagellar biosynthesis protein FlhF [Achromobacter xylosoxidans]MCZ8388510.1 flagellar biosynthesis protein FlhF [Achromobacter xylosoxidans]MEC6413104.1 flagellar biosynthesis protein FlhF [Achromobacter xylosoxidans]QKI72728.1 flagellar biosynthesis protein FlhF [Achromobacter xylosoxidans]